MKIKVSLNSKEAHTLLTKDQDTKIKFEYEIDLVTEGRKPSLEEEYLVLGSVYWALMSMLPHSMVKQYFLHWNEVVKELHEKFFDASKAVVLDQRPNIEVQDDDTVSQPPSEQQ